MSDAGDEKRQESDDLLARSGRSSLLDALPVSLEEAHD